MGRRLSALELVADRRRLAAALPAIPPEKLDDLHWVAVYQLEAEGLSLAFDAVRDRVERLDPLAATVLAALRRSYRNAAIQADMAAVRVDDLDHQRGQERRPGRPRGVCLIPRRADIELVYRRLWRDLERRPWWREVARDLGVDERTLRRARRQFGLDGSQISGPAA